MRMFRSLYHGLIGLCLGALALVAGPAMAYESHQVHSAVRFALASVGHFGAESAKFHVEQTFMVSADAVELTTTGLLARESNGYRLAELVNVAVGDSEVAKGKIGVGAGSVA